MQQFLEILPVLGFILSIGLFGYGLKKVLIKVENDKSKKQLNYQIIQKNNKEFYIKKLIGEIEKIFDINYEIKIRE